MSHFSAPMKISLLILAPVLLAGCASSITNLTPSQQHRNANNLYPFSVALDSQQGSLIKDSIKTYVLMDSESFPMDRSAIPNRWEALVPVPADKKAVRYHYKFDYLYKSIPTSQSSSRLSAPYQLDIVDR
jgi:hypothetical protein